MTTPPISRNTDPDSSHLAGEKVTKSGKRRRQMDILLDLVGRRPGMTATEMVDYCHLDRYQISRRLADLKNVGRIYQGATRRCHVRGSMMVTWHIVPQDGQVELLL